MMYPSLASSEKRYDRMNEALRAGVGAYHVVVHRDDKSSHVDRQNAQSETETETATTTQIDKADDSDLAIADPVHDNDAIITPVPSTTQYDPDSKSPPHKNRLICLFGFAALYTVQVIIVACLIIAVIWSNRKNDKVISADASGSPTMFPTPGPTTGREGEGILGELMKISSLEKLNDPNSAQFKAAQWIQFQDPQQLGVDANNLFQRYALVVMYYSLQENGPWAACGEKDNSYQNSTLCASRFGGDKYYDDDYYDDDYYESESVVDSAKWLSAEHECNWFGIYCESDGSVIIIQIRVDNNLAGTLPQEIRTLTFLEDFRIPFNKLRGPLPVWFSEYRQLRVIEVHYNQLTGPIPEGIYDKADFDLIVLGSNMLSGTISTRIGELRNLAGFHIQDNQFSGTIPTEFGLLSPDTLAFTRWYHNMFSGTLPTEIGNLQKLKEFWFFGMGLSREIPTEIGLLNDVDFLRLESNKFTGTIPEEMYNNIRLERLYLSLNALTGTLSSNIKKLVDIKQFVVKTNYLTGPIPDVFSNLKNLSMLWLHYNNFSGPVPSSVCDLTSLSLTDLSADCSKYENQPPQNKCTCCTVCCKSGPERICL